MRISRIVVRNFRNFQLLDLTIGDHAVIVGENGVGKSNLLFGLRLILDPSLPDSARQLRLDDFWDGLPRPLSADDFIEVSIELTDFEDNEEQLALLAEHLVQPEPMVARLTYRYQPAAAPEAAPVRESDYEFILFGADRTENRISYELRRRLPFDLLPALRDAEGDLANWSRSPLRPLLTHAANGIERAELEAIAGEVSAATEQVAAIDAVEKLATAINTALVKMVGKDHASPLSLGFSPADADRLVRALRLFIDGGKRGVSESCLGSANLLYLVLTAMRVAQYQDSGERSHTFLAIEEPEAHLHPHLQRCVFRSFLKSRQPLALESEQQFEATVLLTTHSPHVVSVSPVFSLVLLRKSKDDNTSVGVSTATLDLDPTESADIERYLDITRGEIVFAKGVILVEGEAEEFLVPVLAERLGYNLDKLGITVCRVGGTHFLPYVKFLGGKGLNIPFAVITDEDPMPKRGRLGVARLRGLLEYLEPDFDKDDDGLLEEAARHGLFLTKRTLEVAMWRCGRKGTLRNAFLDLAVNRKARERARSRWKDDAGTTDFRRMLADIEEIGKGRFAQRWAERISRAKGKQCPSSIAGAIEYVAGQIS